MSGTARIANIVSPIEVAATEFVADAAKGLLNPGWASSEIDDSYSASGFGRLVPLVEVRGILLRLISTPKIRPL
jgi:hypothetical protein